jgi:hypothetical protein
MKRTHLLGVGLAALLLAVAPRADCETPAARLGELPSEIKGFVTGKLEAVAEKLKEWANLLREEKYAPDPNRRMLELLSGSEDLRQIQIEWERIWAPDQPSHLTFERVQGALSGQPAPPPSSVQQLPYIERPGATNPLPPLPPMSQEPGMYLTVANVHKATALLFTLTPDGKMTFIQKLPHGEAVDVRTQLGSQWVAVFPDKPEAVTHLVQAGGTAWVLR